MKAFIAAVVFILAASWCTFAEVVNGIAAKVDTDIITIYEFNGAYEHARRAALVLGNEVPSKKEVMNRLVDNLLIKKEAEARGIVVTDEELEKIIGNIKKQGDLSDEEFVEQLKREGLTYHQLEAQYRMELLKTRLINQMASSSIHTIDEQEIEDFYNDSANRTLLSIPSIVKLSEIFLPLSPDASYQEAVEAKKQANDIYTAVKNGQSFEQLVAQYSQAPNKDSEGYLGSYTKEQLSVFLKPEDVNFIFSLDSGDVTLPIRLQDGYYLFKIRDKSEGGVMDFKEARENIKSYLIRKKGEDLFQSWILKVRQTTKIQYEISME